MQTIVWVLCSVSEKHTASPLSCSCGYDTFPNVVIVIGSGLVQTKTLTKL